MIRSVFTVLAGSFSAQIVGLLALPVFTRLYDTNTFGRYQIYLSSLSVLIMIVAFRYEVALLMAKRERHFENLLKLIIRICLFVSLGGMTVALIAGEMITRTYPEISGVLYILPVAMLIGGIYQMLTYLPIRDRNYRLMAKTKVLQSVFFVASGLTFAFFPIAGMGLIIADLVGRMVAGGAILGGTAGVCSVLSSSITKKSMMLTLYRFRNYPLMTFPGTLLSALVGAMIPIVLFGMFDLDVAGQFALVERFILLPVGFVAVSIAQVFTGEFAAQSRVSGGQRNKSFRQTVFWLALLAIAPSIVVFFTAASLVPWLFGEQWELAGKLCVAAIPIAFVRFVVAPVNMVLIVCDKQKIQLVWEIIRFIFTLVLFVWIYITGIEDPVKVITWYAISVVLTYMLYLFFADRVTREADLAQKRAVEHFV